MVAKLWRTVNQVLLWLIWFIGHSCRVIKPAGCHHARKSFINVYVFFASVFTCAKGFFAKLSLNLPSLNVEIYKDIILQLILHLRLLDDVVKQKDKVRQQLLGIKFGVRTPVRWIDQHLAEGLVFVGHIDIPNQLFNLRCSKFLPLDVRYRPGVALIPFGVRTTTSCNHPIYISFVQFTCSKSLDQASVTIYTTNNFKWIDIPCI